VNVTLTQTLARSNLNPLKAAKLRLFSSPLSMMSIYDLQITGLTPRSADADPSHPCTPTLPAHRSGQRSRVDDGHLIAGVGYNGSNGFGLRVHLRQHPGGANGA
jgi:hypothetical protein